MHYSNIRRIAQVIVPKSHRFIYKSLSDEQAGKLVKAVFNAWASRAREISPPNDESIQDEFFEIMSELDRSAASYLRQTGREIYEPDDEEG